MTIETPLLTAFVPAAGAVLIASVHYRLGKLEEGQKPSHKKMPIPGN